MADFCKECSEDLFGYDTEDLKGITKQEDQDQDLYCIVLCEGCGMIQVDVEGSCISKDCCGDHRLRDRKNVD